jgi:hypothetical protein
MDINTKKLCDMIRTRSRENRAALMSWEDPRAVPGPALSTLRQEVDALIRVIYLLSVKDIKARQRLIDSTLRGSPWTVRGPGGRLRNVTDRDIAGLARKLRARTKSIYRFGCGFIHLSEFHHHFALDPFDKLTQGEKRDMLSHLREHHGGPAGAGLDLPELAGYALRVFEEVSGDLERCLAVLEQDGNLVEFDP